MTRDLQIELSWAGKAPFEGRGSYVFDCYFVRSVWGHAGAESSRVERVEPSGAEWSSVEQNGAEWSRVEPSGSIFLKPEAGELHLDSQSVSQSGVSR